MSQKRGKLFLIKRFVVISLFNRKFIINTVFYLRDIIRNNSIIRRKNKILKYSENLEGNKDFNIKSGKKRKFGISGIARLHNSGEFLEIVIESWIDLYDEIILVDNNSSDNTMEVCLRLRNKYPDKIKLYSYPFYINKPFSKGHKYSHDSSIHSLSYFYNWCFALSNYSIVSKIDDDDLLYLKDFSIINLRNIILNIKQNEYLLYSGINILKNNDEYHRVTGLNKYAGFIGDHGFYNYSEELFYTNSEYFETFNAKNLRFKWIGFLYLHLKFIKMEYMPDSESKFTDESNEGIFFGYSIDSSINDFLKTKL